MSLTKDEIEAAGFNGYHELTLARRGDRGGGNVTVRLVLPPIRDLPKVLLPDILDEAERLKLFVDPATPVSLDDLTYDAEEALAGAIKDFFDMALAKADARMRREEVIGGALAEKIKSMASVLLAWQQKLQPPQAPDGKTSSAPTSSGS